MKNYALKGPFTTFNYFWLMLWTLFLIECQRNLDLGIKQGVAEQNLSLEFYKFNLRWFNISNSNVEGCIYHLETYRAKKSAWNIFILEESYFWWQGVRNLDWEDHQSEEKTISLMYESQTHGNWSLKMAQ